MKRIIPLIAATVLLFSAGCAKGNGKNAQDSSTGSAGESAAETPEGSGSGWYYFSDSGIHAAKNPAEIPARKFVAWTEAVRVADVAIIGNRPSLLINRLGLMTSGSEDEAPAMHADPALFSANTAAGIYFTGDATGIRLYRNSFFTEKGAAPANGLCLVRFDGSTGSFAPYMTAADFGMPANAQCVALDRIGSMWYAAFKYEQNSKVEFSYLEFESFPKKAAGNDGFDLSLITRISSEAYQNSVSPFSFADAPDRLKKALSGLPADTAFNLRVYAPSASATQVYVHEGTGTPVDGMAFVSENATAVLFADGTFYFDSDKTGGKARVLQLPKLSNGYVYTSFILSGRKLLAAWEEQRFFETGRAGLLEITLPDELY